LSIAIEEIRQAIQKSETIAVDCEGVDLSRFGSVTLINIAVSGQVYLIDVLKIGNTAYDGGLRSSSLAYIFFIKNYSTQDHDNTIIKKRIYLNIPGGSNPSPSR
jgi:hypothetical protein